MIEHAKLVSARPLTCLKSSRMTIGSSARMRMIWFVASMLLFATTEQYGYSVVYTNRCGHRKHHHGT